MIGNNHHNLGLVPQMGENPGTKPDKGNGKFRKLLMEHATQMWEARRTATKNEPVQTTNNEAIMRTVPRRRSPKRQRTTFEYLGGVRSQNERARLDPPSPTVTIGASTQPLISGVLSVKPQIKV